MLAVSESIHVEIETPAALEDQEKTSRMPRIRALLKGFSATCLSNSKQPFKAVSIKSVALNVSGYPSFSSVYVPVCPDRPHLRLTPIGHVCR
jgi:hypothetical protein